MSKRAENDAFIYSYIIIIIIIIISLFWKHKQSENTEKQYEQ